MCVQVNFYPEIACVSINGINYTQEELEKKSKDRMESNVLHTLKEIIKDEEARKLSQIEIEFDDVTQLVMSDMFKGDYHSKPLLKN